MNVTNEEKKQTISIPVAYALLAVTVLTWSIGIVIARGVHQEIPPIGLSFWRWFVAATILIPFTYTVVFKNIEFIIVEGKKSRVRKINIRGNDSFSYLIPDGVM